MDLVSLAKNPVPSGGTVGTFAGYDGAMLRYARWLATRGPHRGTVCLFQGRGEFVEKYFETIADLRRRGFAVATMDWRGQGASHRALSNTSKGHVRSFRQFDQDLVRFMKDVVLPDCPPPFLALGHSMGGNILLRNASAPGCWFERIILTAPMLALADGKVGYPQSLAKMYAELSSLSGLSSFYVLGGHGRPEEAADFENNPLTSDRERWMRNKAVVEYAPHLSLGSPTIGWLRSAYRSCAKVVEPGYAEAINVPTLMFAAGNDTIVSSRAIEEFGVRLKIGSTILIPGARHEILQECDKIRQRFWAAFDAYLDASVLAA